MSLVDVPVVEETITDKANKIREKLAQVIGIADIRLQEIRDLVSKYGRANLAAELGGDAAALLTVYTKFKEAIEVAKDVTIEELP
tara:strand:+ start:315 stop:569 length:255 start_codon:yes stop_codon:yes gene_type:complete